MWHDFVGSAIRPLRERVGRGVAAALEIDNDDEVSNDGRASESEVIGRGVEW